MINDGPHSWPATFERLKAEMHEAHRKLRAEFAELQAQVLGATPPPKAGANRLGPPSAPQMHHKTIEAMRKHAPEMGEDECDEWAGKLTPDRVYNKTVLSLQHDMRPEEAQRILYWLRSRGLMVYDNPKKGYILAV